MKDTILKLVGAGLTGAVFAIAKALKLDDSMALALSSSVGGAFMAGVLHTAPGK